MAEARARWPASTLQPLPADRLLVRTAVQGGRWLGLLIASAAVLAAAEALLPAVLGRLIDTVIGQRIGGHGTSFWLACAAVLVLLLASCDVADEIASSRAVAASTEWVRRRALARLLWARPDAGTGRTPGAWANRLLGNASDTGAAGPMVVSAASALVLSAVGVVALFLIDPWLCLTFAAGLPVLTLMTISFVRNTATLSEHYLAAQGDIADRLSEALRGSRTIAAAGTADREARRILSPLPDLHRAGRAVWRVEATLAVQDAIVLTLLEIAVVLVGGIELAHGRISAGELFAASQYVVLASTIGASIGALGGIARARAAAARVAAVDVLVPTSYGSRELPAGPGMVELCAVRSQPRNGRPLGPIDLVLAGGTFVALVGHTDSGADELARLVGRLTDPDDGIIVLDGVPLPELSHETLRSEIGYAFADPALWGGTIREAIGAGVARVPESTLADALQRARAAGFVERLPGGLATQVAETPFSGGERQRIGLARAFACGGRLLVLDDVASSLDSATEREIGESLATELRGRTRVVVAHRATTAARADTVVWLDRGVVRAVGRHQDLAGSADYLAVFAADAPRSPPALEPEA